MCHVRRSLPKAQDRAVLPGRGGGVPCAWEAALHAVCSRTLPVRTGGGSAVQRRRRTVVGSWPWRAAVAGDAVRGGAGCRARADVAVRAELVATPGCAPAANARTAVGDGRTADRGRWGVGGAGARADRDAVGSGDHDRAVGRAAGRSWQSRGAAIVAVLETLACSATLGDRMGAAGAVSDLWGPPRPRLVARWEQTGKSWLVVRAGSSEAREQDAAGSHRGRAPPATKAPVGAVSGSATVGS